MDLRKTNLKGMRRELGDVEWERLTVGQSAWEKWENFMEQMCRVSTF